MELLFRVLVGVFVCVAPTALFLGLWRGLQSMRNGELVSRVAEQQSVAVEDLQVGTQPGRGSGSDGAERRAMRRAAAGGAGEESCPEDVFDTDGPDRNR